MHHSSIANQLPGQQNVPQSVTAMESAIGRASGINERLQKLRLLYREVIDSHLGASADALKGDAPPAPNPISTVARLDQQHDWITQAVSDLEGLLLRLQRL